jgi:hypothetical protein
MVKSMQDGGGVSFMFDMKEEGDDGASMAMLKMRVNEEEEEEEEKEGE